MLAAAASLALCTAGYAPDAVTSLPGLEDGKLSSRMFAGYLSASTPEKHLFYTYVESQGSPATDPLLMWTNGGPGCSSMDGFFQENGPYMIRNPAQSGTALRHNAYTWNRKANYLYIEHPIGVGYSYSDNPADYGKLSDDVASADLYAALQSFLAKFPALANGGNDLYLTGESYGGVYVPQLAHKILLEGHDETLARMLKGFAIGNPVFNCELDFNDGHWANMQLGMFYSHGMLGYDGSYARLLEAGCTGQAIFNQECLDLYYAATEEVGTVDQMLQIKGKGVARERPSTAQSDSHKPLSKRLRAARRAQRQRVRNVRARQMLMAAAGAKGADAASRGGHEAAAAAARRSKAASAGAGRVLAAGSAGTGAADAAANATTIATTIEPEPDYDPDDHYQSFCTGNGTIDFAALPNAEAPANKVECVSLGQSLQNYLRRADVMATLHVNSSMILGGAWVDCTTAAVWAYDESWTNTLTAYYAPLLFEAKPEFRILVYSGDEDIATVPHAETQQCLYELTSAHKGQLSTSVSWTPWRHNGILVGYWHQYNDGKFSYATVKGAGHEAPQYQPLSSVDMIYRWLDTSSLAEA